MKLYILDQRTKIEKHSAKEKAVYDAFSILSKCGVKPLPDNKIALTFLSLIALGKDDYCILVLPDDDARITLINKLRGIKKFNTVNLADSVKVWDYLMDEAMGQKCDENAEIASRRVSFILKDSSDIGEFVTRQKWKIGLVRGHENKKFIDSLNESNNVNAEYHMWGNVVDDSLKNNSVIYEGNVSLNVLPLEISEKCNLGLATDAIDCGFYLASGVPVFVLEESKMAEFVKSTGCGYVIRDLEDIEMILDNITSSEYEQLRDNVKAIAVKVREGEYLKETLKEAIS